MQSGQFTFFTIEQNKTEIELHFRPLVVQKPNRKINTVQVLCLSKHISILKYQYRELNGQSLICENAYEIEAHYIGLLSFHISK